MRRATGTYSKKLIPDLEFLIIKIMSRQRADERTNSVLLKGPDSGENHKKKNTAN